MTQYTKEQVQQHATQFVDLMAAARIATPDEQKLIGQKLAAITGLYESDTEAFKDLQQSVATVLSQRGQ